LAGCGTTADALHFGGASGSNVLIATTEKWNGSTWATTAGLNVLRVYLTGCGTTGNALSFGGGTTAALNTSEKYSGFTGTF